MSSPYTVTPEGVQLNDGATFEAHGHINIKITTADGTYIRDAGIHFDPYNNQPGGAFIGQSFYPVELAEGECIGWVQWSGTNYHFGENGEAPVCLPGEGTPLPVQPDPVTRQTVEEGAPDCDELSVTITTTDEAAGYYLGDDGGWHLGGFFPTGEPVVTTREATAEECPTPVPERPEDVSRVVESEGAPDCESLTVTITGTREVAGHYLGDDNEWHLGGFFPVDSKEYKRPATSEECPATPTPKPGEPEEPVSPPALPLVGADPLVASPVASVGVSGASPVGVPGSLASTGADPTVGLLLALVAVVAGGSVLLRRAVR